MAKTLEYNTKGIDVDLSPIGEPINCCELVIYDNDGPEGFFKRVRAKRSSDLIKFIFFEFW